MAASSSIAPSTASRSKASRVSKMASRHSRTDLTDDASSGSLSNPSLGADSQSGSYPPRSALKKPVRKSFSFKSVRRSFASAASFGGMASCSSKPKMKFSKLNTPELEQLSFPTDNSVYSGRSKSTTRSTRSRGTTVQEQEFTQHEEDPDVPIEPAERHPVPMHTCALIAGLASFFISQLPTWKSLDQVANIETFTNTVFDGIPLTTVIGVRLLFALIMLGNAASVFLYGVWDADTDYFPGSKLRVVQRIPFRGALAPGGSLFGGIKCISTFTLWCWIVEGTAFLLAGMIPLFHYIPDTNIPTWVFRLAMILWEVGAPVSILVSAVVKYALWPMAMEHGENVKLLKAPGALLQHNLNSLAALMEVGVLGGMPVRLGDFAFPPLYGILYLLYTYFMMYKWTDPRHGPQFFYPFFDTTLGPTTSYALIALLAVLSASFCIFVGAEHLLLEAEKYIAVVPLSAIVMLSMMVCRVQD